MIILDYQRDKGVEKDDKYIKILFPLLMVIGALGSLITNITTKGEWATSLQWFGAMLLYAALLFRNM